jgi:hypothetical protein
MVDTQGHRFDCRPETLANRLEPAGPLGVVVTDDDGAPDAHGSRVYAPPPRQAPSPNPPPAGTGAIDTAAAAIPTIGRPNICRPARTGPALVAELPSSLPATQGRRHREHDHRAALSSPSPQPLPQKTARLGPALQIGCPRAAWREPRVRPRPSTREAARPRRPRARGSSILATPPSCPTPSEAAKTSFGASNRGIQLVDPQVTAAKASQYWIHTPPAGCGSRIVTSSHAAGCRSSVRTYP